MARKRALGRPKLRHASLLAALLLACPSPAPAEAPDWSTDRPDQTEGSSVVGSGRTQLESGLIFSEGDDGGGDRSTTQIGGSLLRVGFWERVELRFGWDGWIDERSDLPGGDAEGLGNSSFGTKLYLAAEEGKRPEVALLAAISIPTGDDDVAGDRVDPAFRFSMSHALGESMSIGLNAGMAWESLEDGGGDHDRLSNYVYTLALGFSHSDRLGSFVEFFGEAAASADGAPANLIDGGVTYRIRERVQLDLSSGLGISHAADDWFISSGLSILFD